MRATFSRSDFVTLCGKMQGLFSGKPSLPILSNILVEAKKGQLILSATDRLVSMCCYLEAKVEEEGAIALPARRFFQLARELQQGQLTIRSQAQNVAELSAGGSRFKLHGIGKLEFPPFPNMEGSPQERFSKAALKEVLSKAAFAAAREESRYMLHSVQIQIQAQQGVFIGTDGKRVTRALIPFSPQAEACSQYLVPIKAVEEMLHVLDEEAEDAFMSFSCDKIGLECGRISLISKLYSGAFPDVEKVIPTQHPYQFSLHREELASLLRQICLFTAHASSSAHFLFEDGQLSLSAMSHDIGEGRVTMPVDFSGPRLEIALNPFHLLDILRHSKEETVTMSVSDPHCPILVTDTTETQFLLMPMRLAENVGAAAVASAD